MNIQYLLRHLLNFGVTGLDALDVLFLLLELRFESQILAESGDVYN